MRDIILIGGGGHCKSCIDVIEMTNKYNIIGILDRKDKVGSQVLGYNIVGTDDDIPKYLNKNIVFLLTIGQLQSSDLRVRLFEKIKKSGGEFATIVSPRAYVSKYALLGEGSIIMHGAQVNAGSKIGKNCIINSKALIEHDCNISDNCHVAVGAVIAGGVDIGECSFIGANSTIVQSLSIPCNTFVKAGSLVK